MNIMMKIISEKRSPEEADPRYRFRVAITRCFPLLGLIFIHFYWFFFVGSDIFTRQGRMLMYTLGCVHSKILMGLMIAHLTDLDYHPFGKTSAAVVLVAIMMIILNFTKDQHDAATISHVEDVAVYLTLFVSTCSLGHMIISVIWEMSTILKIRVFCIPSQKKKN